jgi:uncharacterized protein (AIM24 family)
MTLGDMPQTDSSVIMNMENDNRHIVQRLGRFSVLEHERDLSVAPDNAQTEYFMSKMGVRRRQVMARLDGSSPVVTQAGAMQWFCGDIELTTGVKGVGDYLAKSLKGAMSKESAIKPEYTGVGTLLLEPTHKFGVLENVADWGSQGMVVEDGMFLACDGTVSQKIVARTNASSALAGGEGLFNLSLAGTGTAALECNVPQEELIEIDLVNDTLKIDGHMAMMWSASLDFTVERSSKTLVGSAYTGEGLVNVYRGTGKVMMSPVASTRSLPSATHEVSPKR